VSAGFGFVGSVVSVCLRFAFFVSGGLVRGICVCCVALVCVCFRGFVFRCVRCFFL